MVNQYMDASAVTPSDSAAVGAGGYCVGLWVGGAGNVAVVLASGVSVTFTSVPAGTLLPIYVTKVKATGTTATNIVALYS